MATVDEIRREIELPHRPDRVWQAITDPTQVAQWFGDHVSYELTPGAPMHMAWDQFGEVSGRIEVVEPTSRFAFRWRATGVPESEPMTARNSTLVTYYLDAIPAGTRLIVSETGFATLPEALRIAALRENNHGWDVELAEFLAYMKGGPA
ncbi:MAG: SRPBCC domain-containing protein [Ardenticatenales bacterium]|nr:SRPBCC domain-containing protein [Ardenticatenales bacterium]